MANSKYQSELELENNFIAQLEDYMNYKFLPEIHSIDDIKKNIKKNIEFINMEKLDERLGRTYLTDTEMNRLFFQLDKLDVFETSMIIHDKDGHGMFELLCDNNEKIYIQFFNVDKFCLNNFQVVHQVNVNAKYKNRFDVTLLVNGFPIIQVELKKSDVDIMQAYNQIIEYKRNNCYDGIFKFTQLFVISNGNLTRYFANNNKVNQMLKSNVFYWTTRDNVRINKLKEFTFDFFKTCNMFEMVTKYMAFSPSNKRLMIMRPYQIYACEELVKRAVETNRNGYIWASTGSGKSLTSFKAAQILRDMPEIEKVIFLVDRHDLDVKTKRDFKNYSNDDIDDVEKTNVLVEQLEGKQRLIISTMQKLDCALRDPRKKYLHRIEHLRDKKIIFIYDEIQRSQAGKMHDRITDFFEKSQHLGMTGTPIFEHSNPKMLTNYLFEEPLHTYLMDKAISDGNVLPFSIDYINTIKEKNILIDEKISNADYEEVIKAPVRIHLVADDILKYYDKKTKHRKYNAILATSSIDSLMEYYNYFKSKVDDGTTDLRITGIFTAEANVSIDENPDDEECPLSDSHKRMLDKIMHDYDGMYKTGWDLTSIKEFDNDIQDRFEKRGIDLLLVVNKYLTGSDFPRCNTIFIDKALKMHTLIQAFSRTNRTYDEFKTYGNIICYQTNKKNVDKAFQVYTNNKNAYVNVTVPLYDEMVKLFNDDFKKVEELNPSCEEPASEQAKKEFVVAFKNVLIDYNKLVSYKEFDFANDEVTVDRQAYNDYVGLYQTIYNKLRRTTEKESILDSIDFEIQFLRNDIINYDYLFELLKDAKTIEPKIKIQRVYDIINTIPEKDKRELVEQFVISFMALDTTELEPRDFYEKFMTEQKEKELNDIATKYFMKAFDLIKVVSSYEYGDKTKTELSQAVFKMICSIENPIPQNHLFIYRSKSVKEIMQEIDIIIEKYKI